jgi:hypothetical protein
LNELIAFKALELLVAIGIIYSSYRISDWTSSNAWQTLSLAAVVIAVKALGEIFLLVKGLHLGIIEGTFAPSMAILLSGVGLSFVDQYGEFGRIDAEHFVGFVTGVVLGTVGLSFLAPDFMVNSLYYMVTPLLLLPGIYSFYQMQKLGEKAVFLSMLTSVSLFFVASVMNIYLALVCKCSPVYGFSLPFQLPAVRALEIFAFSAPVFQMTGILFLGFAVYLAHHGVFRSVNLEKDGDSSAKDLVSETVDNLGAIVGKPVVERMSLRALNERFEKDVEKAEQAAEGEESEEVKEALEEALGDSIGPVAERKIEEIYREKGEQ